VRMEGWRQRRLGSESKNPLKKKQKVLTRTVFSWKDLARTAMQGRLRE
jgi:hypothetical protein